MSGSYNNDIRHIHITKYSLLYTSDVKLHLSVIHMCTHDVHTCATTQPTLGGIKCHWVSGFSELCPKHCVQLAMLLPDILTSRAPNFWE